jgi:formylglycine-generating enzyme required for sulfatase activity
MPVRQYMTAGSADETVPDESIFCEQFVSALRGEGDLNGDGYVTGQELYSFLEDRVINYSRNTLHPQFGKIKDPKLDKGDFVFQLASAKPAAGPAAPGSGTAAAASTGPSAVAGPPAPAAQPLAARPPDTPVSASLAVSTTPAGAMIGLDGRSIGRSPASVTGLSEGEHIVSASLEGYKVTERRVLITRYRDFYQESLELSKANTQVSASSGIELAAVGAGSFIMGDDEAGGEEAPAHRVDLRREYAIGVLEVTNRQFCDTANWAIGKGFASLERGDLVDPRTGQLLLGIASSSRQVGLRIEGGRLDPALGRLEPAPGREGHPVSGTTWFGAAAFCNWLSERDGLPRAYASDWTCDPRIKGYRLPTEAEWEYAARGKDGRRFPWGRLITKRVANFMGSGDPFESLNAPYTQKGGPTSPAGFFDGSERQGFSTDDGRSPSGVYDMAGNVREWCNDWKGRYTQQAQTDPQGPARGTFRVSRGGSWSSSEIELRASDRSASLSPDSPATDTGFRITLTR